MAREDTNMKNEKQFLKPEANIIAFMDEDIILTSVVGGDGDVDDEENPISGII